MIDDGIVNVLLLYVCDIVDNYKYLGTVLNYNGSYVCNIKALSPVVTKAMFALLLKGRKLSLDVDTVLHLFDTIIKAIQLYNSEVWVYCRMQLIARIPLIFLLMLLLKLNKNTPNVMVYGELGCYPLHLSIKVRMASFGHKIVTSATDKIAVRMYKLLYSMFQTDATISTWLLYVKQTLDYVGLTYIWLAQGMSVTV